MPVELTELLRNIGTTILAVLGIAGILAIILFIIMLTQVRKINVPPGAGFADTLLHTPFIVVIFLDVMDLALDFLGAPIAWVILDRIGLKALRAVAAVEALIPFTNFVPTMTIAWLGVRLLGRERVEAIETMGSYTKYTRQAEVSDPNVTIIDQQPEKSPPPSDRYDYYSD
jgi:hypothetical protein